MKIISWNVNGIRAALSKGAFNWIWKQSADTVCLQEIKARPDQLTDEQLASIEMPYRSWNPAIRPGYSGVATFSRNPPSEVSVGGMDLIFDREGRVIRNRSLDFILYNIYFPNGQRGADRLEYKLDFYARLLEQCDGYHAAGDNIIITGDFNTAHMPIDLKNPKENQKTSGFLPKERAWVQKFLDHGFVDIYRQLYPNKIQYTWWTYRLDARARGIGWRIDYFLVSKALVSRVKDVIIHEAVLGSDHCPVELVID